MNLKNVRGLQAQAKVQKEAIVFSSDDSMNSDNSFNSSLEDDETEDYKNTIFHLKEQMNQFFLQHPGLEEAIKFEPFDFNDEDNHGKNNKINEKTKQAMQNIKDYRQERSTTPLQNKSPSNDKQKSLGKTEFKNFSSSWKILGKDVIRNSQGGQTLPTLETINHRLNIFKQKIEKIDYLELLQKETINKQEDTSKNKNQLTDKQPNRSQSEQTKTKNEENLQQEEQDLVYFSFKKKMQMALHKRQELQKEEEEKKLKAQKEKMKKGLGLNDSMDSDSGNKTTEKNTIQCGAQKQMEFQTHVGQMLYQTYQQTGGDKESFKKMAAIFLKNYHKKQKENLDKLKVFPPVIPKFTSEDCKHLNLLLPDFQNQLYAPNKQNIFQGAEQANFPANSPEQEFINLIDQILEGKVMQFWRELHQTN